MVMLLGNKKRVGITRLVGVNKRETDVNPNPEMREGWGPWAVLETYLKYVA